jgi:hypothetical protein
MDLFARFRNVIRIQVSPEEVRFDYLDTSVAWSSTICLEPESTRIYDVGKDSCAAQDGVFIRIFDRGGSGTDERLREIGLDRFFAYGALVAHESLVIRPLAEVSGLATFDRRDRDEVRASIDRALRTRQARIKDVSFLD